MTTRNTRIVTKMFNQEVKTMAKNYNSESSKNRSGASNTKNTFVENCGYRSENSSNKNSQNCGGSKNKNSASGKNCSRSENE